MFRKLVCSVAVAIALCWAGGALGANSVVVQSMSVSAGDQNVVIPIALTNDIPIRAVELPFIIRRVTGDAFITAAKGSFGDRMVADGFLSELSIVNQYHELCSTCSETDPGFPNTPTYYMDTMSHEVSTSPIGVLFYRSRVLGTDLPSGSDTEGSALITVDIGPHSGVFEIDTLFIGEFPYRHILAYNYNIPIAALTPDFTPGVITVSGGGSVNARVDINPGKCPNNLNVNGKGKTKSTLAVAILGHGGFDVMDVDPESVLLEGVAPVHWKFEDVSRPSDDSDPCECTRGKPDAYMDLTLEFPERAVVEALGSVDNKDERELTLTGQFFSSVSFEGSDCVVIHGHAAGDDLADGKGIDGPTGIGLSNHPNPFNSSTTISFSLDQSETVHLAVYNILGQTVATLVDGPMEAGEHSISWDGRTSSGDVVPTGIYFYRLIAGNVTASRKALLLK